MKGFIPPKLELENYILGASPMPFVTRQEDGNWFHSLPVKEYQNLSFETYNCTSFNTLNAIETYMFKVFGLRVNYSDRWLGIVAGTKAPGNDPHTVMEAIRKYGLIPEEMLPWNADLQNIDEYYSFKGADREACYRVGREWLAKYEFFHEYCFKPNQPIEEKMHNMKIAIKSSPLCGDVDAWRKDERGVYIRFGQSTHWTSFYHIPDIEKCFDSYEPALKDVDQEMFYVKRIHIEERVRPLVVKKKSLWELIRQLFVALFS